MNERREWAMVLATISICVMIVAFLPALVYAGELEPSAPPGSTMHTLDEIYQKLEQLAPSALAPVVKTGQSMSYAAGDDGDLEKGVVLPDPRFTDNWDGTVTDNLTGLIWLKDANCFGTRTWTQALNDCNNLADGSCGLTDGSSAGDWRLPNVRELHSLIDYSRYSPPLSTGYPFSSVQSSYYWSSTTYAGNTTSAFYVSVNCGRVLRNAKSSGLYMWCVRGGQ